MNKTRPGIKHTPLQTRSLSFCPLWRTRACKSRAYELVLLYPPPALHFWAPRLQSRPRAQSFLTLTDAFFARMGIARGGNLSQKFRARRFRPPRPELFDDGRKLLDQSVCERLLKRGRDRILSGKTASWKTSKSIGRNRPHLLTTFQKHPGQQRERHQKPN